MVMVMIVIYDHEVARDDGNANQSDYYQKTDEELLFKAIDDPFQTVSLFNRI